MKNKPHKLWVLFLTTLYISAFTFGGGFVIVTFMKHKFVDELHWIDEQEMLDFTALAQSCPGAIAVNAAILVGWNVYGFAGMIVATLGTILPPMIILSVVSFFYAIFSTNVWVAVVLKGMQAGVAAVILDAACSLGESVLKEKSSLSIFIMTAAFVCDFFFRSKCCLYYSCSRMYRHHSVYMVSVQAIFSQANTEGNTETKMLTGDEIMIYIQLFLSFVQIGLFSVGGGYAAIPLIQSQVVETHGWLTMNEFTNLITIAEMTPGPIGVNSATFTGLQIAGIPGALAATFGSIFPSCILVSILALVYCKYKETSAISNILSSLRPAVVALITAAGFSMFQTAVLSGKALHISSVNVFALLLFIAAFIALRKWKLNPILIMCLCGVANLFFTLLKSANF